MTCYVRYSAVKPCTLNWRQIPHVGGGRGGTHHSSLWESVHAYVIADSKGGDLQMGFCNTTFSPHLAASPIATTLAYPASMTTPSESGLTFTSDSVSLHPPPFFLCSPSITLSVQYCKLPLFITFCSIAHISFCCFFSVSLHLCGRSTAAVTQAVNTSTSWCHASGESVHMHTSPAAMHLSDSVF